MELKVLLGVLAVYRSNFHVLHWLGKGEKFHTLHEKAAEYYEKLLNDMDDVAEIVIRLGGRPLNYVESYSIIKQYPNDFVLLDTDRDYSMSDFIEATDAMLSDILELIEKVLENQQVQSTIGVKSYFENLHNEYDKEFRYLNKRR